MKKILYTVLAAIACAAAASATSAATLDEAKKNGLVLGFSNEPPFAFKQADGSLAGSDVDLARLVLGRLGVNKIDGTVVAFGSLIPGLQAKRFDFIATGLYIVPARCSQVAFTEPNFSVAEAVLVPKGNPKNIHSLADIAKNENIRVGGNTTGQLVTNAMKAGVKQPQITHFPDITSNLASLKAGRIDASLIISVTARWTAKNDPGVEVPEPFTGLVVDGQPFRNYGAFAFHKDDADLRNAFNAEMVKAVQSPVYVEILRKYGMTPAEVPSPSIKLDALCATK